LSTDAGAAFDATERSSVDANVPVFATVVDASAEFAAAVEGSGATVAACS
jgi:hypothetical protein